MSKISEMIAARDAELAIERVRIKRKMAVAQEIERQYAISCCCINQSEQLSKRRDDLIARMKRVCPDHPIALYR
jgi:hypothetical protein